MLADADRKKYLVSLIEEGMKQGELKWKMEQQQSTKKTINNEGESSHASKKDIQEREVMRIFAQNEYKRREVEERQRKFEQRERQQEDDQMEKERRGRKFDKQWRNEERVDKRIGNWRDFTTNKKRKH